MESKLLKVKHLTLKLYAAALIVCAVFSLANALFIYLTLLLVVGGVISNRFKVENIYDTAQPKPEQNNMEEDKMIKEQLDRIEGGVAHIITLLQGPPEQPPQEAPPLPPAVEEPPEEEPKDKKKKK